MIQQQAETGGLGRLTTQQKIAVVFFPFAAFYYALTLTETVVSPWQRIFMILIPKSHIYLTTDAAFDQFRRGLLIWYFLGVVLWVVLIVLGFDWLSS